MDGFKLVELYLKIYMCINFDILSWICFLPCWGGLHRFPWVLLIYAVQRILGCIQGLSSFQLPVDRDCKQWELNLNTADVFCNAKHTSASLFLQLCVHLGWEVSVAALVFSQQHCCFCACKLLRLKSCGWILPLSIIHSVHIYYVFLLLSAQGSMLKIGQISYAFVEFPFVLENVYHVFRKFEEKKMENTKN